MKGIDRAFDREIESLLEQARAIRPLPDVVRARALTRARAAIAKGTQTEPPPPVPMPARGQGRRIALAAAFALMIGGAGAIAAIRGGLLERLHPPAPAVPPDVSSVRAAPSHHQPRPAVAVDMEAIQKAIDARRPRRAPIAAESYAAELDLLHRAQIAYASRDFSSTLLLVAEHARRFPNGRLAEEREALRVRSLAGSGRRDDARHAVATFAARFPRSVLLPRLQETGDTAE